MLRVCIWLFVFSSLGVFQCRGLSTLAWDVPAACCEPADSHCWCRELSRTFLLWRKVPIFFLVAIAIPFVCALRWTASSMASFARGPSQVTFSRFPFSASPVVCERVIHIFGSSWDQLCRNYLSNVLESAECQCMYDLQGGLGIGGGAPEVV